MEEIITKIAKLLRNNKINYDEIEKIENEELQEAILQYCVENNIEIVYENEETINNSNSNSYLNMRAYKLLTKEEVYELIEKAQQGDIKSRNEIVEHNMRLVASIARKYEGRGIEFDDLFQNGIEGMIRAIEKFDTTKGCKFSTYATIWIRQSITRAIANDSRTIRVPVHVVEQITRLKRYQEQYFKEHGTYPTQEEMIEHLNIDQDRLSIYLENMTAMPSLDEELKSTNNDGHTPLYEFVEDTETPSVEDQVLRNLSNEYIQEFLNSYTRNERDKQVFIMRYGLDGNDPCTLEEIGERFGITRERVRQIEEKMKRIYKAYLRSQRTQELVQKYNRERTR